MGANDIPTPHLPEFDGRTTHGEFYYLGADGSVNGPVIFSSGGDIPQPNYPNSRHVEGHSASYMRQNGI